MSNIPESVNETQETSQDVDLESLPIARLRKFCGLYNIPFDKDATKEDLVNLIRRKRAKSDLAVVSEVGSAPAPGWARIMIHRQHGTSNRPVYVNVNGYRITIPKNVEVDVPIKVVGVLNDAKEYRLVENEDEAINSPKRWTNQPVLSYPFQVVMVTPGPDPRPGYERSKASAYGPRKQFHTLFGRWPKRHELIEAIKEGFVKMSPGDALTPVRSRAED